jgi:hypothetical protein
MITNIPWTFVVVFAAIFVVLLVFAAVWLMSPPPSVTEERLPSKRAAHGLPDWGPPSGEVSPDGYDEMDGAYASRRSTRPAEPVHS